MSKPKKEKKNKSNRELYDDLIDNTLENCNGIPKTAKQKKRAELLQEMEIRLSDRGWFNS